MFEGDKHHTIMITDKHIPLCTEDESDKRDYYEKKV
jgi:hypothetical protein